VIPKTPKKQNPNVAVSSSSAAAVTVVENDAGNDENEDDENAPAAGLELVKAEDSQIVQGSDDIAPEDSTPQVLATIP
jgi:hypothetical protein